MKSSSVCRPQGWKQRLVCGLAAGGGAVGAFAACFVASTANAQGGKPVVVAAVEDGPSEKPPMVLQNRYFLKRMRPEVNLYGGQVLNEPYSQTWMYGARAGLFLTEAVGVEYTFEKYASKDSADLTALRSIEYEVKDEKTGKATTTHTEPSFTRLKMGHVATLTFAPVYGKVNLLDWVILYSDIYANVGAGALSTSDGSKVVGVLGVGQRFYFAKSYSFRVDAVDHVFSETRENRGVKKKNVRNAWTVGLGFSAFLWE